MIEHLGTSATVTAAGTPAPASARDLNAWHGDTFVNGPAWPEFAKAMGLDDPAKSTGSVYVVSVYRAAPGHRDDLEKSLSQPNNGTAGNVLLQHLEGGPWNFLTVVRYNSWEDFGKAEKADVAETLKPNGGWLGVRNQFGLTAGVQPLRHQPNGAENRNGSPYEKAQPIGWACLTAATNLRSDTISNRVVVV